jgi:hypothetical protein
MSALIIDTEDVTVMWLPGLGATTGFGGVVR